MLHVLKRFAAIVFYTLHPSNPESSVAVLWLMTVYLVALVAAWLAPQYGVPILYAVTALGCAWAAIVVTHVVMPASIRDALLKSLR